MMPESPSSYRAALGGNPVDNAGGIGVFDYFTSVLLRLPELAFGTFVAEIKAEEYLGTGIYYVNCGSANKLPNLTVTLEGLDKPLVFPYRAYIDLVSRRLTIRFVHPSDPVYLQFRCQTNEMESAKCACDHGIRETGTGLSETISGRPTVSH